MKPTVFQNTVYELSSNRTKLCFAITVREAMYRTYKATLRRVRETIVAISCNEYYIFRVCVCKLSYPGLKTHWSYYVVICGLSGSTIVFHIVMNDVVIGRRVLNLKYFF